jgi:hypothetical protein
MLAANYTVWSNPAVPSFPSLGKIDQPAAQPFDTTQGKPAQQAPEVVVPVKEWPKVEAKWSEPFLTHWRNGVALDLPPAEKGFYRGTTTNEDGTSASETNNPKHLVNAYVIKILPQLEKMIIGAAVVRDPVDRNVVFVGTVGSPPTPLDAPIGSKGEAYGYLLLSLDGEKSWYQISRFAGDTPMSVRVLRDGDTITLFAGVQESVAPMWRKATLSLKDLS